MIKDYKALIKTAIAAGKVISVHDGECWEVVRSNNYKEIIASIESVEEAEIRIRDTNSNKRGWALIIAGLEGKETIADYSGDFIEEFCED